MAPLILIAFMAAFGYLVLLRPLRTQKRMRAEMMAQLTEGAEVLTVGGIFGRVLGLRDEDLDLEVADGVVLRVSRRAVAAVTAGSAASDAALPDRADPEAD